MMKVVCSSLFLLFLVSIHACAQPKNLIVKSSGYFMIPTPGTIPVDDNGQPLDYRRDTVFLLFVETKGGTLKWERAWKNGRSFSVIPSLNQQAKITVGEAKTGNRNIELTSAKGNALWQIELSDDQKKARSPQPLGANEVLLQGKAGKKSFYVRFKSLIELASPMYQ